MRRAHEARGTPIWALHIGAQRACTWGGAWLYIMARRALKMPSEFAPG